MDGCGRVASRQASGRLHRRGGAGRHRGRQGRHRSVDRARFLFADAGRPRTRPMTPEGFRKRAYNIEVARLLARRELPRIAFDFIDGGAEDEISLRRNEEVLDHFAIAPRPFESYAGTPSQAITLFGRTLNQPVVIGPAGLAGLFWPEGELAVARAAEAAGTMMIVSHGSTCTFEEVAAASGGPKVAAALPLFGSSRDKVLRGARRGQRISRGLPHD